MTPSGVENASRPRGSRIAAARARAESAKTALVVAALFAFFGAMFIERGPAPSGANRASVSDVTSVDDDDGFESGGITSSQAPPVTSTATS